MLRVILEDAQGFNLQDGRGILKIDSLSSGFQEEELSRERNEEAAMSFFFVQRSDLRHDIEEETIR